MSSPTLPFPLSSSQKKDKKLIECSIQISPSDKVIPSREDRRQKKLEPASHSPFEGGASPPRQNNLSDSLERSENGKTSEKSEDGSRIRAGQTRKSGGLCLFEETRRSGIQKIEPRVMATESK